MPPKRRTSGITPKAQQSTLAFHGASNKVTKSGTRAQNAKKNLTDLSTTKKSKSSVVDVDTVDDAEPTTAEAAIIEQTEQEVVAQKAISTPEEDEARGISDARIKKYWAEKENARIAPRVHQENLSLSEKILREFDMTGQYGVSKSSPHPSSLPISLRSSHGNVC
jgi:DNA polymerase delta subunit 4